MLSMDMKCPYMEAHGSDPQVAAYAVELARYLEKEEGLAYLKTNPQLVGPTWPEFVAVAALPAVTQTVRERPQNPPYPDLKPFSFGDEALLREFLLKRPHTHSSYTVAGLLGWLDLIQIWGLELEGALCLFAEQAGAFYMPLPPLSDWIKPSTLKSCWEILTKLNQGNGVSRIEGIEPAQVNAFKSLGFQLKSSEPEYLYLRQELADLKGDPYRAKRWGVNRALRLGSYVFRPFEEKDLISCLQLYTHWGIQRQQMESEPYSKALIRDGLFFHRRLMMKGKAWNLSGWVLEVEGKIQGYTFAAAVNEDTIAILLEIVERQMTGLAQLIFRELCRQVTRYTWINAMGDSNLTGLRQAKESYHPAAFNISYRTSNQLV